jgi:hypothetical protein
MGSIVGNGDKLMATPSDLTLTQRFAVAKAYLDTEIPLSVIADLADIHPSQVADIAREVLGSKYFVPRYKKPVKDLLSA